LAPPEQGRRIGLVEDDPIMGESLVQRLRIEGAGVIWWRTRDEAVRGLGQNLPDLVVCDLRLPDGSGEEVFQAARRAGGAPFLFMTAYADIDQAVRLMRAGAGDYVTKPFEMGQLLGRIRLLLAAQAPPAAPASLRDARGGAERAQIERVLMDTGGRIGEAAKRLGVSRTTLWARMKALGIERGT
jgi:DNA-binding NtrC family response regulator